MPMTFLAAAMPADTSILDDCVPLADGTMPDLDTTVTQVGNLAKTINDYGPLIVALALIMVLLILVMGFMLYRTNKTINDLQKAAKEDEEKKNGQIDKLLDHLLNNTNLSDDLAQKVSERVAGTVATTAKPRDEVAEHEKKDIVGMYIDVNMAFKSASRVALGKLRCSRIAIYVFHNGNRSLHGLPFFKMSCVHEWTIRGSKTIRGKTHSEMPLHMYTDIVEALAADGEYVVSDVQQQAIDTENLMDFVMSSEVKSLYMLAIRDSDDVLAGFSIAEYNKAVDFTDHELFELNHQALTDLNESIREIVLQDGFMEGFKK